MATYTDNYQFTKPTYAEIADVQTFNNNMTKIDEILHASQVSLAPAYDPTHTYDAGEVVMYELLMYECQEDGVTGVWDPTKWARTTAGEHGGGSDVEPNPTGEPTATLNKLGIEGTIYGIEGSGGGNVYGAFIDTNRVIQATKTVEQGSTDTYTATEDCFVIGGLIVAGGRASNMYVNGVAVSSLFLASGNTSAIQWVMLKRGDVLLFESGNNSSFYTVYGLTFGTENIFTPQIYSTEERCVGVWINNKPLYAKTIEASNLVSGNNTVSHNIANIEMTVENLSFLVDSNGYTNQLPAISTVNGWSARARDFGSTSFVIELGSEIAQYYTVAKVTMFYTKTTDTAGDGSYNTLGVPMVHYSTDEQVIGTFEDANGIIKPLYQKMVRFINIAKNGDIPFGVTGGENYMLITGKLSDSITLPYIHGSEPSNNIGGFFNGDKWSLRSGTDAPSTVSGFIIIQYTKTTD